MVAGAGAALPDRPGPGPGPGDDLHAGPNYIMDNYSEEILHNHNLDLQQHTMLSTSEYPSGVLCFNSVDTVSFPISLLFLLIDK